MSSYYDENYYNWQKNIGVFGGLANQFKFIDYIKKNDKVVDFGSGGGFLLKQIKCANKIGIEINDVARKSSLEIGIKTVKTIDQIPNNWANVIISNHALEHCERPLDELKNLKRILKSNGLIIFVLPHEISTKFYEGNISNHLYTWSEISAGNIFVAAGFKVLKVETIHHTWPPYYLKISRLFGFATFNIISKLYSYINTKVKQVRVIATK